MKTAYDLPEVTLDDGDRQLLSNIQEHAWQRIGIPAEGELPGFSFTIGLWYSVAFPEVLAFSLPSKTIHDALWEIYRAAQRGSPLPRDVISDGFFGNAPGVLLPVAKRYYREHLGYANWFYGNEAFPCYQLVWPDRQGLFPWQAGFDERFRESQPDLSKDGWANIRLLDS